MRMFVGAAEPSRHITGPWGTRGATTARRAAVIPPLPPPLTPIRRSGVKRNPRYTRSAPNPGKNPVQSEPTLNLTETEYQVPGIIVCCRQFFVVMVVLGTIRSLAQFGS
jgi:hypothetical protein